MSTTSTAVRGGISADEVRWVVAQASRAPSIHNTQPWRFTYDDGVFGLYADIRRGLVVADPDGRELTISCGAALYNLCLALRQGARTGVVELLPDRRDPRLMARVTVEAGPEPSTEERRLFAALGRRHTRRGGYAPAPVSPQLSVALQEAATAEGATLHYVTQPGPRAAVLHVTGLAARLAGTDSRLREEIEEWAPRAASARRDGVPASAYSSTDRRPGELAARDFDLGRGIGTALAGSAASGPVGVLVTDGDLQADWLRAGQALEAVLLTAAAQWAFASLHSRACEVPHLRAQLRRELRTAAYPHLLLRIGHAHTAPTTPRRPVEEVVDITCPRQVRP